MRNKGKVGVKKNPEMANPYTKRLPYHSVIDHIVEKDASLYTGFLCNRCWNPPKERISSRDGSRWCDSIWKNFIWQDYRNWLPQSPSDASVVHGHHRLVV